MDQARQDSLFKYLKYLGESHATSIKIGNVVKYVTHFLEHTESLSRKGYMKYKSDNGEGMSRNYPWNDCILEIGEGQFASSGTKVNTMAIVITKKQSDNER